MELSGVEARRLRFASHLLAGSDLSPAEVVARGVAFQGQDLPAVLRAIAIRSRPGTTLDDVRDAFDRGDIVRSWPMRGTLFATTPAHLATILHHTSERMLRSTARRRAALGLDEETLDRARRLLTTALQDRPLTRADALALWQSEGIATDAGRGYHLIFHLAEEGLAHWGPFTGAQQQLVPTAPHETQTDLAPIIRGYVLAHGPTTADDAAWWLKLPKTVVREAAARVDDLRVVTVEGSPAWIIGTPEIPEASGVTLVPGFDEWILGYADRSLVASPEVLEAVLPGGNGIFRPTVLVDGVAVGTWRGGELTALVGHTSAATRKAITRALEAWPHG